MVRVHGLPSPHLKRAVLEGSGDRQRWTMLVSEGTLFDLPDERLNQNTLGFPPGAYRYLRVTWDDTNSGRLPMPSAVDARREIGAMGAAPQSLPVLIERRPSEPGLSRYRITLPGPSLPVVAFDLDAGGSYVYRKATVTESRFERLEAGPVELGTAMLSRVTRDGATASALRIPVRDLTEAQLDLTIEDGENPPLELRGVSAVLAQLPWIYLDAPAGAVVARYGNPTLEKPVYDLEAVRDSLDLSRLPGAAWGDATSAPRTTPAALPEPPPSGGPLDPALFAHSRTIERHDGGLVSLPLDAHVLAFSRGPQARFSDVRILDAADRQVPYLIERRNEPLSIDLAATPVAESAAKLGSNAEGRQRSVYAVALPYPNLPPGTLVLESSARVFQRTVSLGFERKPDSRHREPWFDVVGVHVWRHADEQTAARPLAIPLPTTDERQVTIAVDEGDNAPLPITSARLLLPSYRLRFFQPSEGTARLVYGRQDLVAPEYDLALLARRVMGASVPEVTASEAVSGGAADGRQFISPTLFWSILGVAVVVLLGLIVRLIRSAEPPPPARSRRLRFATVILCSRRTSAPRPSPAAGCRSRSSRSALRCSRAARAPASH